MHFFPTAKWNEKDLNNAVKATYPQWQCSFDKGLMLDTDLELLISTEVEVAIQTKSIKRKFKSKIVTLEGKDIMEYSFKGVRALDQRHFDSFKTRHPDAAILNLKTDDELVAIIKELQ
jgi:hypothetical protein